MLGGVVAQPARAERRQVIELLPLGGFLLQHAKEVFLREGARERLGELPTALVVVARVARTRVAVKDTEIAQRPEVVLAEPAELVLEVAVRSFERGVIVEIKAVRVLLDA